MGKFQKIKSFLKRKTIIWTTVLSMSGLVIFGFSRDEKNFEIAKNLDIYFSLFRELNLFYVDDIDPAKLVKTSIDKMLDSLDPYTNYIPESEMEEFNLMTTGEYAGIGALIGMHGENEIIISEPYEGFPAQKAGLHAGDVILEIDGKSTQKMTTQNVSDLLKGPVNKEVKIKILRPGTKKTIVFDLVREKIQIDAVPYYGMLDDKTGYIRLSNFTQDCSEHVRKAMVELKEKRHAKSLILDLRGNPGGLLYEAVRIANLFVPKGQEIVSTRGKVKQNDKSYYAESSALDPEIPLAVLVNSGSASASEIVAGALQDIDRAVIIGTRTFGKGLVQTTRDLSFNTKLKVTTAKYYIPSGRCIQALDYSHRNEDGSVGHVPDSLISEFRTKHGRKVYNGGGVLPDIIVESSRLSNLSINLVTKNIVFDFATQYFDKVPRIADPENFKVSEPMYNEFVEFVKQKNFTYTSGSEEALKEVIETAKKERYYDISEAEIKALQKKLAPNSDKDLKEFEKEIKSLIKDEIVSRYYFQKGAIKASLMEDEILTKAIDVLHNSSKYISLLNPKSGKATSMIHRRNVKSPLYARDNRMKIKNYTARSV
ncbi:MAG: S41 family peptidase [Bacteroidota bacterium]|nr:S41 family peptidase [Bacteroidota bacterium]MDP4205344.1 S41 family peptidase [Bacteroidota bacterium]